MAVDQKIRRPFFPNNGSYRVLVVIQRTGEFQESPQDFSTAGTGQAISPPKPPEDQKCSLAVFFEFWLRREARVGSLAFDYLCSPLTVGLKMPLTIESQQIIAKWCIPQGHLDGVGAEAWFCNICLQHLRDDEQAWDHCIGRNKKHAKNYRRMRLPTINLNAMD